MDNNTLLMLLILLVPAGIGIINLILPSFLRKSLTLLGLAYCLVLVYQLYGQNPRYELFNTTVFQLDQMAFFAMAFIQVLSFVILIFSLKGVDKEIEKRFFILYPMTVAFCNGVVISEHTFSFLIFWGFTGLSLYLFGLLGKTYEAPKTAKKTFIIIGGSDALLIMGLVIMWLINGSNSWLMSTMQVNLSGGLAITAFIFLLIAAFAKAGGFPFHTWVPDFAKDAPIESAAFLPASLDKLLGIYLLARIMTTLFTFSFIINLIVITLGAVTVITAVMMAMTQHNARRLLGYHAVSQVGYMIMGIGSGSILAFAGGLFHMVNHTIYKSNLFLSLGSVEKKTNTSELDYLGGLGKVMPLTFIMALIGALSISGVPPFNGFFSKWMIYQGLLEKTATLASGYQLWMLICLILAVFGSALTLASFMKFLHAVFLGRRPEIYDKVEEAPANQWIGTGLLAALCILFGVFAAELPLKYFVYPAIAAVGFDQPEFAGLYLPQLLLLLFGIAFLVGLGIFLLSRKIRYDEVYLGGMDPLQKFRVAGTEFYNEIKNMPPLKTIYAMAEKKYFDLYELGAKSTFALSEVLKKGHPGQLQLYLLYMIIGLLVFIALIS